MTRTQRPRHRRDQQAIAQLNTTDAGLGSGWTRMGLSPRDLRDPCVSDGALIGPLQRLVERVPGYGDGPGWIVVAEEGRRGEWEVNAIHDYGTRIYEGPNRVRGYPAAMDEMARLHRMFLPEARP